MSQKWVKIERVHLAINGSTCRMARKCQIDSLSTYYVGSTFFPNDNDQKKVTFSVPIRDERRLLDQLGSVEHSTISSICVMHVVL